MESETWRPVTGFEQAYEVSDLGRVRSVDRMVWRRTSNFTRRGQLLVLVADGDGYLKVQLGAGNQRKVHRLVAEAFVLNPNQLPEVDHEDTDKMNCRADNLRWCTRGQNNAARHQKTYRTCEVIYGSKVREKVCAAAAAAGAPTIQIAKLCQMSRAHVRRIVAQDRIW